MSWILNLVVIESLYKEENMTLQVIGAGFGRTGTRSLKVALEALGFGKCYHMEEVIKHPAHLNHWIEAAESGSTDWEALFKDYQSAVDWPASAYYKTLMAAYPDAKVILTVRDPESWYESISTTLYPLDQKYSRYLQWFPPGRRFIQTVNTIIWEGIFQNRLEEKDFAIQVFKEHIEEVKRAVPPERLLIFDAKQGWQPLCAFLGVPVPTDRPFPHVNHRAMWVRLMKYGELAIWGAVFSTLALLIWLARWASSHPED